MKHSEIKDIIVDLLEEIVKRTNYINHHHPGKDMSLDIDLVKDDLRLLYRNFEALKQLAYEQPVTRNVEQHAVSDIKIPSQKSDYLQDDLPAQGKKPDEIVQASRDEVQKEAVMPDADSMEGFSDQGSALTDEPPEASALGIAGDEEEQTRPPENEPGSAKDMPESKRFEEQPAAPERVQAQSKYADEKHETETQQEQLTEKTIHDDQPQPSVVNKGQKPIIDLLPDHRNKTIGERFAEQDNSVHQRIAGSNADQSIGARLQQKPISNIKEVIGVNEKFLFINELFDGNIQEYYDAIARLNDAGNMQLAFDYLNELGKKFSWDNSRSTATIEKLAGYIQRRYI